MPVINVTMLGGVYDAEVKTRIAEALTDAMRTVIAAPPEGVIVALNELPAGNYMRGRTFKTPGPALPDAREVVKTFLERMEARDLTGAQSMLADGFRMVFPGGVEFSRLEELIDWAKPRYNWVKKTYDDWDVAAREDGVAVTCQGTLRGEFPDGTPFEGIRFVDWFLVRDGKLSRQHVWNDLGEYVLSQAGA
ncbi:DUF4440 domain-containing protein [Hwanghaeella grinnelliae]|uniref:DUF4440 domain-containing protein n=1 Tax=Hwanghaeella grinnelliae TaxID=2500179 RepID=A0A3S2W2C2_9PROT|nr:tautomerase family protein [Hwanghaeella grinnelliae]RVU34018.1 DUF4440 domain-containing protein [Hwanghaeella grinnelliae]